LATLGLTTSKNVKLLAHQKIKKVVTHNNVSQKSLATNLSEGIMLLIIEDFQVVAQ
jgi:hypothetical protein